MDKVTDSDNTEIWIGLHAEAKRKTEKEKRR
jgi:hypothetical protein